MLRFKVMIWGVILMGILAGTLFYMKQDKGVDKQLLATAKQYGGVGGQVTDRMGDLGLSGKVDDVYFKQNGDDIELYYGNRMFKLNAGKDMDQLKSALAVLGVDFGFQKDGKLVIKYKGEVVKEIE
jgi:hypothetical protein